MVTIDVLRFTAALSVLAFAAITDLTWRRAPDAAWWVLAGVGAVLLSWQALAEPEVLREMAPLLIIPAVLLLVAWVGYLTGFIGGGADAKAIMALAVLAPLPLDPAWTVPWQGPFPLVLTMLMNGLFAALAVPLFLAATNLARGQLAGWITFLAFPVAVERLDYRVVWPLEYVDEDGELVRTYSPKRVPIEGSEPEDYQAAGIETVWVTPKVPFLVPLFVGVAITAFLGDPLAAALEAWLA